MVIYNTMVNTEENTDNKVNPETKLVSGIGFLGMVGSFIVGVIVMVIILSIYNYVTYGTFRPIMTSVTVPVLLPITIPGATPGAGNATGGTTGTTPGAGNATGGTTGTTPVLPNDPKVIDSPVATTTPTTPIPVLTPQEPAPPALDPPWDLTTEIMFDKTPGFFQIGEIEIYADGRKLSKNDVKITGQSSSGYGHTPDVVMDGSPFYDWANYSVWSSDNTDGRGWLNIAFNQPMALDKLVVYNRTDCCQDRLNGVQITIKRKNNTALIRKLNSDFVQEFKFSNELIPDPITGALVTEVIPPSTVVELPPPEMVAGSALGPWAGTPYSKLCNTSMNDYVSGIDYKWGPISDWMPGSGGIDVSQVTVKCASGTSASFGSNESNYSHKVYSFDATPCGGFTGAKGLHGWGLVMADMNCNGFKNIPTSSADGGGPWYMDCPAGQKIRGVSVKAGKRIGSIGFACK